MAPMAISTPLAVRASPSRLLSRRRSGSNARLRLRDIPKVGTVCFGVVASQAAIILAGGEKGMRYTMPDARVMIHQPQGGSEGNMEEVRRQVGETIYARDKVDKVFAAFTGQPVDMVQQ